MPFVVASFSGHAVHGYWTLARDRPLFSRVCRVRDVYDTNNAREFYRVLEGPFENIPEELISYRRPRCRTCCSMLASHVRCRDGLWHRVFVGFGTPDLHFRQACRREQRYPPSELRMPHALTCMACILEETI